MPTIIFPTTPLSTRASAAAMCAWAVAVQQTIYPGGYTLAEAGLSVAGRDGRPTDAVKVGTIKRAKGLEFKEVLLPWIAERLMFPGVIGAGWTDSQIERDEGDRRELFVGITRARDGVWVGCIAARGSSV